MAAPDGIVWGSTVGSYGRIGIYTSVSKTETEISVSVELWIWTKYSVSDSSNTLYYNNLSSSGSATTSVGSVSVSTTVDSGDGWSTSNQKKLKSYSYTYTRKTSASTRYLYAKFANIDRVGGTMYASTTVSIPKLDSYTVKYDANGGTGAPSSQTKWHGTSLSLSSAKPTRTGYTFQGWSTSDDTSVEYAAGASYKSNASVTLYAVWKANTYTVSYNANGGTGAPSKQTKTYGVALTLQSDVPTRANYAFKGWGTSASATTVSYAAGAKYTANSAITLYAVWELAYTKPRINDLSVGRCDSAGTASDTGTYALVKFSWACDKTVTSVKIEWKLSSATSWTGSKTINVTGTSGSVNEVIGGNALSSDSTYSIRATVTDSSGSNNATKTLNGTLFPIDVLKGGDGLAFGKPAETKNYVDFNFLTRHRKNIVYNNAVAVYGRSTSDENMALMQLNAENNIVLAYGGYQKSLGQTRLYGNSVSLLSREGVLVDGCQVAKNKVLWSGAYYMMDSQTCTLSESVSLQANGIVLVWSWYSTNDSEAKDQNFQYTFIPKYQVGTHSGKGSVAFLAGTTGSTVAVKYVYISNTTITGYSNNNAAEYTSGNGLTLNPKSFVLRYVIGV